MVVADKTKLRGQVLIASCPVLPGDITMINRKYCGQPHCNAATKLLGSYIEAVHVDERYCW